MLFAERGYAAAGREEIVDGLGMVREALRGVDAAGRLKVGPVDALALVVMAVLYEAATAIANGDDPGAMHSVIDGMITAITV